MAATTDFPPFTQPEKGSYVWRYFNLAAFLDLLVTQELILSRVDRFEDKFETSLGLPSYDEELIAVLTQQLTPDWKSRWCDGRNNILETIKKQMFVSCWHLNSSESMAMWKIYSKTAGAVAIKCRYDSLVELLPQDSMVGRVTYYDHYTESVALQNIFFPIMHKRKEYFYEDEVRVVRWIEGHKENRSLATIDLSRLIESVYISPGSDTRFRSSLEVITQRLGYYFNIVESDLLSPNNLSFRAR